MVTQPRYQGLQSPVCDFLPVLGTVFLAKPLPTGSKGMSKGLRQLGGCGVVQGRRDIDVAPEKTSRNADKDTSPDHAWLPHCLCRAGLAPWSERMVKGCGRQAGLAFDQTPADNAFRREASPWES